MMKKIRVTNEELFYGKNVEVFTENLNVGTIRGRFIGTGHLRIVWDGDSMVSSGEFGRNDFEEDFGFVFEVEKNPKEEQYFILRDIQRSGYNVVTCGDCETVNLVRFSDGDFYKCHKCGFDDDSSSFPDLFY
ncbi:MAG: hypothetical protein ACYS26_05365 [Planctomycetota bacterium]|jgi:hypothetical protein